MITDKLQDFMRDRFGAFVLNLASSRCTPGMLLHARWRPVWFGAPPKPHFRREEGYAWDYLGLREEQFPTELVPSNIIQQEVTEKVELEGEASIPQLGIAFEGSSLRESGALIRITGIQARVFSRSSDGFFLFQQLLKLRQIDPARWDWVNDDCLVTEGFHVTSFRAEFQERAGNSVRAAFEQGGARIGGGMSGRWESDSILELEGTAEVPLAVRGLRV